MTAENSSLDIHLERNYQFRPHEPILNRRVDVLLGQAEVERHFGNHDESRLHFLEAARLAMREFEAIPVQRITMKDRLSRGKHGEVAVVGLINGGASNEVINAAAARVLAEQLLPTVSRKRITRRIEQLNKPPAQA